MQSFYLLVPLALIIIALAIKLLFWAINSGQYDDLDTEGHRILFDDDKKTDAGIEKSTQKNTRKDKVKNTQ